MAEAGLQGLNEIAQLVKKLEDDNANRAWDLRLLFPFIHKGQVNRVNPASKETETKRRHSLLKYETQPHQVILAMEEPRAEADDEEYCDPLHPVSIDYTQYPEEQDRDYLLNHFSLEELEGETSEEAAFDPAFMALGWGVKTEDAAPGDEITKTFNSSASGQSSSDFRITAWGPEAGPTLSVGRLGMRGLKAVDDAHQQHVEEAIKRFWEVVNADDDSFIDQESRLPNNL